MIRQLGKYLLDGRIAEAIDILTALSPGFFCAWAVWSGIDSHSEMQRLRKTMEYMKREDVVLSTVTSPSGAGTIAAKIVRNTEIEWHLAYVIEIEATGNGRYVDLKPLAVFSKARTLSLRDIQTKNDDICHILKRTNLKEIRFHGLKLKPDLIDAIRKASPGIVITDID